MHFDIYDDLKTVLVDAGFVNAVERRFPVPIGSRARGYKYKEAGCWNHARLSDGLKDFSLRVLTNAGQFSHVQWLVFGKYEPPSHLRTS
jgi:hypothetical protein